MEGESEVVGNRSVVSENTEVASTSPMPLADDTTEAAALVARTVEAVLEWS